MENMKTNLHKYNIYAEFDPGIDKYEKTNKQTNKNKTNKKMVQ